MKGRKTAIDALLKQEKEKKDSLSDLREILAVVTDSICSENAEVEISCNLGGARKYKVAIPISVLKYTNFHEPLKKITSKFEEELEEFYNKPIGERGTTVRQVLDWKELTSGDNI